jgi:hypothetical protein
MSNKYDTIESAAAALVEGKKPDCVIALNTLFYDAVENKGLSFREATVYAKTTHYLNDHDGYNHLPSLRIAETDEAVIENIENDIANGEFKVEAEYFLRWYKLIRTWGIPVAAAFAAALPASVEEFEDHYDLDEAEIIAKINELSSEEMKDSILRRFYTLRNAGESVRASIREAKAEAQEQLQVQLLQAIANLGSKDNGLLN